MPEAGSEPPEAMRTAWQHAVDGWDEQARHDLALAQAAQHDCYAWLAARYKERAGDAIAARQLVRVRNAATAAMLATATARKKPTEAPYRNTIAVLIALVIAAVCGLIYAMMLHETTRPH